jgi:hypothetical protein
VTPDQAEAERQATVSRLLDEWAHAYLRRVRHDQDMNVVMAMATAMLGVPYGPALCETRPSQLRGTRLTTQPTVGPTMVDQILGRAE